MEDFTQYLDHQQLELVQSLTSPAKIQAFLDSIPYSAEERNRSTINVLCDRQAHCLDGGLFAAAALRRLGYPPIIVDLLPEPGTDDDHVLAIFKRGRCLGALAKSNFPGLRYREPVYRNLRELIMSYFEVFFNVDGKKTLRGYTRPVHLEAYDKVSWMVKDEGVDFIEKHLKELKITPVIDEQFANELSLLDKRSYESGMLGVNAAGLYKHKS
jgi:hypothetical protein